jgi:hypothetical protein
MTCFLKRLSRFSCDSPSFKTTVANLFTSFPIPESASVPAPRIEKPGASAQAREDCRVCTVLALNSALFCIPAPDAQGPGFTASGPPSPRDHSTGTHSFYMVFVLPSEASATTLRPPHAAASRPIRAHYSRVTRGRQSWQALRRESRAIRPPTLPHLRRQQGRRRRVPPYLSPCKVTTVTPVPPSPSSPSR